MTGLPTIPTNKGFDLHHLTPNILSGVPANMGRTIDPATALRVSEVSTRSPQGHVTARSGVRAYELGSPVVVGIMAMGSMSTWALALGATALVAGAAWWALSRRSPAAEIEISEVDPLQSPETEVEIFIESLINHSDPIEELDADRVNELLEETLHGSPIKCNAVKAFLARAVHGHYPTHPLAQRIVHEALRVGKRGSHSNILKAAHEGDVDVATLPEAIFCVWYNNLSDVALSSSALCQEITRCEIPGVLPNLEALIQARIDAGLEISRTAWNMKGSSALAIYRVLERQGQLPAIDLPDTVKGDFSRPIDLLNRLGRIQLRKEPDYKKERYVLLRTRDGQMQMRLGGKSHMTLAGMGKNENVVIGAWMNFRARLRSMGIALGSIHTKTELPKTLTRMGDWSTNLLKIVV